jgi:inner membrane protein
MMSITHATIAVAGTSLILGTASPLPLALAILGSQLPDIDTTTSTIGQICYPIAHWIETRYPHRTVTHCLLATAALGLVSLGASYTLGADWKLGLALPIGHLLACFADCFTKQGVMLFYPYPVWCVSVSNPRRRLKTGGAAELWVLAGAVVLLAIGIYLGTSGGIAQQVSQTLGIKEGALQTYNEQAARHQIYAQVEGVWASDRTSATGRYPVIAAEGSEFVVLTPQGMVKTGQQVITNKVTTEVGQPATTQIRTLTLSDQDPLEQLQRLRVEFPAAGIYLSGQVTVDAPEEVELVTKPNQLATLTIAGNTATLNHHPIEAAVIQLQGQFATGTLTAKIMTPRF